MVLKMISKLSNRQFLNYEYCTSKIVNGTYFDFGEFLIDLLKSAFCKPYIHGTCEVSLTISDVFQNKCKGVPFIPILTTDYSIYFIKRERNSDQPKGVLTSP